MSIFFNIKSQRLSNLFRIEFMLIQEKIMFLGFFILKFLKSETLLVLLVLKLVVLSPTLSLKLHIQFDFRVCENFFTNRAVPLLFKGNLLLLRHEPSILVLLMKFIPLPSHKFSTFVLLSLISKKSFYEL